MVSAPSAAWLAARQIQCQPERDQIAASVGDAPLTIAMGEEAAVLVPRVFHLNAVYLERLSRQMLRRVALEARVDEAVDAPSRGAAIETIAFADADPAFRPVELRIASAADIAAELGGE
jgi:hypothetical protein